MTKFHDLIFNSTAEFDVEFNHQLDQHERDVTTIDIKFTLSNITYELKQIKNIGEGGGGSVKMFDVHQADVQEGTVALKFEDVSDHLTEKNIAGTMLRRGIFHSCGTVPISYLGRDGPFDVCVMPYFPNTLETVLKGLSIKGFCDILDGIRSQLSCLFDKKFVYIDVKPGNILMDDIGESAMLADYGSMVSHGESWYPHTFCPPEGPRVAETSTEQSKWALIAWQLGILCAHYLSANDKCKFDDIAALSLNVSTEVDEDVLEDAFSELSKTDMASMVQDLSLSSIEMYNTALLKLNNLLETEFKGTPYSACLNFHPSYRIKSVFLEYQKRTRMYKTRFGKINL